MARISSNLKGFVVYSTKPDGTDRRLGDDSFSAAHANTGPRSIAFFFAPSVSPKRCVQIDPVPVEGQAFTDSRVVCVGPLSEQNRILADAGWAAYQQTLRTTPTPSAPKPTATPGRAT
jgi:hypothetical protein